MSVTVYHGSIAVIEKPLANAGRQNLDFGLGFYVTDVRIQAVEWAKHISDRRNGSPVLNIYFLDNLSFASRNPTFREAG